MSVSEQEEDRDAVFETDGAGSATDDTAVASGWSCLPRVQIVDVDDDDAAARGLLGFFTGFFVHVVVAVVVVLGKRYSLQLSHNISSPCLPRTVESQRPTVYF